MSTLQEYSVSLSYSVDGFYRLRYKAVYPVESEPPFRRDMSPLFGGWGDIFLQNIGWLSTEYRPYIAEDITRHNHPYDNLKSYKLIC
jgi:hypothetical protein